MRLTRRVRQLSAAAHDFGFSDRKRDLWLGGYLSAGFFAIGAPAAVLVSMLRGCAAHRGPTAVPAP
jgi:hypothetical protein